MRNSKLNSIAASLAAVAMIVSLGTSTALARGGGGHGGGFGGSRFGGSERTFLGAGAGFGGFHPGGGLHPSDRMYGDVHRHDRFYGGYNACVVNPYNALQNPPSSPYSCY